MQAPDRGFGGGFGGGRKCFPYVVMSSPAGEESQWWGRALPGTLIFMGVRERDVWLAPHCGGGTGVTVPGLGAVGSGGRGVPGSVEEGKMNQLG